MSVIIYVTGDATQPIGDGPIRNRQMAEYADAVALFPGGKGTASMAREAERAGLMCFDFRGDDDGV